MPIFNRITYGPVEGPVETSEAYAVFDSSDGSFTFFRDIAEKYTDGQVSGTKTYYRGFEDITGKTAPSWYDSDRDKQKNTIKTVVFKDKISPETCYEWFTRAEYLTSITGLDKLDTANVTDMSWMFGDCTKLTNLDVSSFNTAKVKDMRYMFGNCSKFTSLDLSSFNTANVTDMSIMFMYCSSLTSLDLSSFDTFKVRKMKNMFNNCSYLKTIYASSLFTTDRVYSSSSTMFGNCTSLVSGAGTKFDANHIDKTYARIDGGTSNPGYFTAKVAPAKASLQR